MSIWQNHATFLKCFCTVVAIYSSYLSLQRPPPPPPPPERVRDHKAEVICVDRRDRDYALEVEARLWILGIERTDILFPSPAIPPDDVMADVAAR